MGFFDNRFRGLLDSNQFAISDHMGGIKESLAENAMAARKPGLFGRGSKLWDVVGVLGDAATGQPGYAQSALKREEMERRAKQYQPERQGNMADWEARQKWKLGHPQPADADIAQDHDFWKGTPSPDQPLEWLNNSINPVPWVGTPYISRWPARTFSS